MNDDDWDALAVGGLFLLAAMDAKRREEEDERARREAQAEEFYRILRESRKIPVEPPGRLARIVAALKRILAFVKRGLKRLSDRRQKE